MARDLIFVSIAGATLTLGWYARIRWREVIKVTGIILLTAFILSRLAGAIYFHPRPFVVANFTPLVPHPADNGFPSDHALLAAALAGSVWWFNRKAGLGLAALALLIGEGRILAGVHHLIDIIASFVLVFLIMIILYYSRLNSFHIKKSIPRN